VDTTDSTHVSRRAYQSLQESKELAQIAETDAAAFVLWNNSVDAENVLLKEQELSNSVLQAELFYQESLAAQQQLTAEHAAALEAEAYRLDLLRAQMVTTVAVDPTKSVEALMSDVGSNLDLHRQIASVMVADKEITKLIVASTATLWNHSYDIMEVIARQSTSHKDVAEAVAPQLPSDSLLLASLRIQGQIS
jgi:hypothetical protein